MGGVPRRRKRPHREFMPLWKEHAALTRESRLASLNFQKGGAGGWGGWESTPNFTIDLAIRLRALSNCRGF